MKLYCTEMAPHFSEHNPQFRSHEWFTSFRNADKRAREHAQECDGSDGDYELLDLDSPVAARVWKCEIPKESTKKLAILMANYHRSMQMQYGTIVQEYSKPQYCDDE